MDIRIYAQLMSRSCTPRIAQLVVRIPGEKAGDDFFQTRLISSLVYGSMMSNPCQYAEAKEMVLTVTERLFAEARPDSFSVQDNAHMIIVSLDTTSFSDGRDGSRGAPDILATVQPTTLDTLPTTKPELEGLRARLEDAWREILDICHRVSTERTLRSIAGR